MEKQVEFKVGKDTLRGKVYIPDGKPPFPGVIFFHGSGGVGETQFETAKLISRRGIVGFAFNYRGTGLSEGKFEDQTISMGVEDGKSAVDFLLSIKELDKNRLGFVGGSFGGYVSSMICNTLSIKSMVLEAPASYPASSINNQRDTDRDLGIRFEESKSYEEIAKYKGDLMIQICELDDVLPEGMAEMYFDSAKNAKKKAKYIIKGAKHRLSVDPIRKKDSQDKIISWFLETL